ncbi:MAG: factor-independent urate hydroxylase, partial [Planctomycetota bacterium]
MPESSRHPLAHNAYGKHRVRVSKIKRPRPRNLDVGGTDVHEFIEASVNVTLEGDLAASYTVGDNANVVATDTCRNTVYAIAKDDPFETIESFGVTLAEHFLKQYDHLTRATVELAEHRWHRIHGHAHCFTGSDGETPTAKIVAQRGLATTVAAGLDHLMIAKTTQTGFENFHRDEYRTLPDTDDRIFATVLAAEWSYASAQVDFPGARETVRDAMLAKFTDHYSKSVQET